MSIVVLILLLSVVATWAVIMVWHTRDDVRWLRRWAEAISTKAGIDAEAKRGK